MVIFLSQLKKKFLIVLFFTAISTFAFTLLEEGSMKISVMFGNLTHTKSVSSS